MVKYCLENIPHTYVYRRSRYLSAGTMYVFETRDLHGPAPDTYLYLVRGENIVAKNDDYSGLASLIAYQPTVSGYYTLIIRGYSKYSKGTCDVYQKTGGGAPVKIDNDVKFGGYPVSAHWKSDERIETTNATGDTYLFLIRGNTMLRNDDGGAGLHSKITPGYHGYGLVVVGSFSGYSEGTTRLCNFYQSYLDNPGRNIMVDDPKIIISDAMAKFQTELLKYKESLDKMSMEEQEKLSIQEQENKIKTLRDKLLRTEDINMLQAPDIHIPKEILSASNKYSQILEESEKKLKALSISDRIVEMEKLQVRKKEIFGEFIPQEE